jgi:N-acetylglutamate synthase-like GNAT family acetyltransferase
MAFDLNYHHALFVEARGKGVGEQLIRAAIEKAQNMRYSNLYLLTFDVTLPDWYEKLGWKLIGMDELNGYPVSVMKFSL